MATRYNIRHHALGNWRYLLILVATASFAMAGPRSAEQGPRVLGTDPSGSPYRVLWQTEGSTITGVHASMNALTVEFTGRWFSSSRVDFPDTGKTGFTVNRRAGVSQAAWDTLVRRFSDCRGKSITLFVFIDREFLIREGTPLFQFPNDRVQIVLPGEKFNFPIGYQF